MKKVKNVVLLLGIAVTLAACSEPENAGPAVGEQEEKGYDILETTASAEESPQFLEHANGSIPSIYEETADHQELLTHIPCYCGCGESAGHEHAFDCFIDHVNEDNTVVWNNHGMKCGVCLEIAAAAVEMKNKGYSDREIRETIDETYNDSDMEPTPTPKPQV
ncbi:PCYCGC motif-containing (lipo)protein [Alteribacillus sp. YIM 98480]|uniref:PCYCGC motif-containing (lipo)protein n=1 Tax=Alteribacillus sp. YIM 98480 TaxID=2606599 RepID=UPI00131CC295|nr:PCYCGC motif-containing (lipo)protein [Alteribacillus sp. YIM 98480]